MVDKPRIHFDGSLVGTTDRLTSDSGGSTFVLDNASFAIIRDFQRFDKDKIQLKDTASDYSLSVSGSSALITLKNANGSTDVIGQVNTTNVSFSQNFIFG